MCLESEPPPARRDAIVRSVAEALHARDVMGIACVLGRASVPTHEVIALFGDAGSLIAAVARTIADEVLVPLADGGDEAAFRMQLAQFGQRLASEYRGRRFHNLYRLTVNALGGRSVREKFYAHGPGRVRDGLARYFESAPFLRNDGVAPDGRRMAECFLSLLRADWNFVDASVVNLESDVPRLVEAFFFGIERRATHV